MPTTDWKAVVKDLKAEYEYMQRTHVLDMLNDLIKKHTYRTEEDLPEEGNYHVRTPNFDWCIAKWENHRVVGILDPHPVVGYGWFDAQRLALEIGPQILPPSETVNTTSR